MGQSYCLGLVPGLPTVFTVYSILYNAYCKSLSTSQLNSEKIYCVEAKLRWKVIKFTCGKINCDLCKTTCYIIWDYLTFRSESSNVREELMTSWSNGPFLILHNTEWHREHSVTHLYPQQPLVYHEDIDICICLNHWKITFMDWSWSSASLLYWTHESLGNITVKHCSGICNSIFSTI